MIDNIYKPVKPSQLKKLQIMQNIKNLMFQVIFCSWGKQIFERMMPGAMSKFFLPKA